MCESEKGERNEGSERKDEMSVRGMARRTYESDTNDCERNDREKNDRERNE
jgi:hypothetical protein